MSHSVIIQFAGEADIHRVRNFGEALFQALPAIDGHISLQQIDTARDQLEVAAIYSRKLKRILGFITTLLAEHGLTAEITMYGRPGFRPPSA